MAEAADRLGIDRFSVVGASGGCPYALACAHRLGDRVTRVGIVAGVGPLDATGMPETQLISGPSKLRVLRKLQWRLVARAVRTDRVDTVIDRTVATMTRVDRQAMKRPDVRDWYRTLFTEAFAQGSTAASYEGELYRQPWGFDPADITTETNLWHGAADQWVPISTARWLADRVPNSQLTEWPDHGHFSWAGTDEAADVVAVTAGERTGRNR
jgi:pimeloyl-ACP methyl ester carboxylesterase